MLKEDIIDWQDFVSSNNNLFGHMKEGLIGKLYTSDEEVKTTVMLWRKEQSSEFYELGIHAPIRRENIAIEKNVDYVRSRDGIHRVQA